jgi:xanthine/CO dehydrogenase XdhC/CoxF family maturation factor
VRPHDYLTPRRPKIVSILAEIIMLRNGGDGKVMKDPAEPFQGRMGTLWG